MLRILRVYLQVTQITKNQKDIIEKGPKDGAFFWRFSKEAIYLFNKAE
jgi:hypothetical protein